MLAPLLAESYSARLCPGVIHHAQYDSTYDDFLESLW